MLAPPAHDDTTEAHERMRRTLDPRHPQSVLLEDEPSRSGEGRSAVTLFLTGSECPLRCVFCDLAQFTLLNSTSPGDIPSQIRSGLQESGVETQAQTTLKLYNASNFFEDRAVPPEDDAAILDLVRPFRRVVVECHPRWIGGRFAQYAEQLGDALEVAMGLETCYPAAFEKLGKGIALADFDRAAERVVEAGASLRVFVLVGAPFVPKDEASAWVRRSVEHAATLGARAVSLIPLRPTKRLSQEDPLATAPSLSEVETALETTLDLPTLVSVDPWDLKTLNSCAHCVEERIARIRELSHGRVRPTAIHCKACELPMDVERVGGER